MARLGIEEMYQTSWGRLQDSLYPQVNTPVVTDSVHRMGVLDPEGGLSSGPIARRLDIVEEQGAMTTGRRSRRTSDNWRRKYDCNVAARTDTY
jgi:hypothetical protein